MFYLQPSLSWHTENNNQYFCLLERKKKVGKLPVNKAYIIATSQFLFFLITQNVLKWIVF